MRDPVKSETAQLTLDDLKVEQMFNANDTAISKTVKIYAPFPLKAYQRLFIVYGKALNVANSAGRQQGEYLYSATVTLLHEDAAVYTSAPCWASGDPMKSNWPVGPRGRVIMNSSSSLSE